MTLKTRVQEGLFGFQGESAYPSNLPPPPTKLQLSKAQSGKDYWLKVSKQKKEERQGQKIPYLSEFPF
jgi:hypothetical protein